MNSTSVILATCNLLLQSLVCGLIFLRTYQLEALNKNIIVIGIITIWPSTASIAAVVVAVVSAVVVVLFMRLQFSMVRPMTKYRFLPWTATESL